MYTWSHPLEEKVFCPWTQGPRSIKEYKSLLFPGVLVPSRPRLINNAVLWSKLLFIYLKKKGNGEPILLLLLLAATTSRPAAWLIHTFFNSNLLRNPLSSTFGLNSLINMNLFSLYFKVQIPIRPVASSLAIFVIIVSKISRLLRPLVSDWYFFIYP